jgi:hypothetical protein
MRPGRFKALRAFYLRGQALVAAGSIVELDDGDLISELMSAAKIEAADAETRSRLRMNVIQWAADSKFEKAQRAGWIHQGCS